MTKRRIVSLLLVICMVMSLAVVVGARASAYLVSYSVSLAAKSGGRMVTDVLVNGVTTMNKIGVNKIRIEEKYTTNGSWHPYATYLGSSDPDEFYDYNEDIFLNDFDFTGTPGYYYRVTVTVYAGNSQGSDTGTITSVATLCKA